VGCDGLPPRHQVKKVLLWHGASIQWHPNDSRFSFVWHYTTIKRYTEDISWPRCLLEFSTSWFTAEDGWTERKHISIIDSYFHAIVSWHMSMFRLIFRKPIVSSVSPVKILDRGPLRVSLVVQLKISDQSYIEQVISLDAGSPYIRWHTKVNRLIDRAV
jgi:hypothetical protein